jgi:hypothetical protein
VLNDPYLSSTVPVPSIAESWSQIKLKHHRSSCIPQRQTRIILLPVRWIDSFVFARPPIVRPHPLPCPPYSSPMATRHGQISIIRVIRPSVMLSAESAAALPEASVRPVRQPAAHQPPLPWRHHRREFMSADTTLRPLLARGRHKSGPFGVLGTDDRFSAEGGCACRLQRKCYLNCNKRKCETKDPVSRFKRRPINGRNGILHGDGTWDAGAETTF